MTLGRTTEKIQPPTGGRVVFYAVRIVSKERKVDDFFPELLFELSDSVKLWAGRGIFNNGLKRPELFQRENGLYPLFQEEQL
jgi:hypothetical protein